MKIFLFASEGATRLVSTSILARARESGVKTRSPLWKMVLLLVLNQGSAKVIEP
jgi:hypothetical protein